MVYSDGAILVIFSMMGIILLGSIDTQFSAIDAKITDGIMSIHVEERAIDSGEGIMAASLERCLGAAGLVTESQPAVTVW